MSKIVFILGFVLMFFCFDCGLKIERQNTLMESARYNPADPWHQYGKLDCWKLDFMIRTLDEFIQKELIGKNKDKNLVYAASVRLKNLKSLRKRFCIDV